LRISFAAGDDDREVGRRLAETRPKDSPVRPIVESDVLLPPSSGKGRVAQR
jgi:hypothetical protein